MDNLVEGHLLKIQKDDLLDDLPITSPTNMQRPKSSVMDFLSDDNYLSNNAKK